MKTAVLEIEEWERRVSGPVDAEHEIQFVDRPLNCQNADQYANAEVISPFVYSDLGAGFAKALARGGLHI